MRLVSELSGETLSGRYRLAGRVAGGTGDIYLGRDLDLDRPVAVKVLQPPLADDLDVVDGFLAEAASAARLAHPHIVTIYDWSSHDDSIYFIVMEHVPGADLRDLLVARGRLEPAHASEVMASVCEALAAAHERGVVHGGLRPENILVSRFGTVKVSDFGVAAIALDEPAARLQGSLRYLAPERALGGGPTPSSDLWAAGAILAELLTGRPPSPGGAAGRNGRLARGVPRAFDGIVARACADDPDARFGSAADMAAALRRAGPRHPDGGISVAAVVNDFGRHGEDADISRRPARARPDRTAQLGRTRSGSGQTGAAAAPRAHLARRPVIAGAIVLVVLLGAVRGVAALFAPDPVPIPDLAGLTVGAAATRAQAEGLTVEVIKRRTHRRRAAGLILWQRARGTALEGAAIGVVVSDGPPMMQVPALAALGLDEARARLAEVGMKVDDVAERFSGAAEGSVVGQSPARGKQLWGSTVDITLSRGPAPVVVPDTSEMTLTQAKAAMKKASLEPVVLDAYSSEVAAGELIKSAPQGGGAAPYGSQVRLYVSLGPKFPEVIVPDVRNLAVEAATKALERAGLRARILDSCGSGGATVLDTEPVAGAVVRETDLVALFAC